MRLQTGHAVADRHLLGTACCSSGSTIWLEFFLDGVAETVTDATRTVRAILHLRERDRKRIAEMGQRSANAYRLHDHLLSAPLTTAADVQRVGASEK